MSQLLDKVEKTMKQYDIKSEILDCKPELADTASFCEYYGFKVEQAANTIIVSSRKVEPVKYAVCVILATTKLDVNKKVCKLLGVKRASFADSKDTERLSGMMIGGVTAVGIEDLPIFIDERVTKQDRIVMGGGNRSSKLLLNPNELKKIPGAEIVEDLSLEK